jgi:hypothetical protein
MLCGAKTGPIRVRLHRGGDAEEDHGSDIG